MNMYLLIYQKYFPPVFKIKKTVVCWISPTPPHKNQMVCPFNKSKPGLAYLESPAELHYGPLFNNIELVFHWVTFLSHTILPMSMTNIGITCWVPEICSKSNLNHIFKFLKMCPSINPCKEVKHDLSLKDENVHDLSSSAQALVYCVKWKVGCISVKYRGPELSLYQFTCIVLHTWHLVPNVCGSNDFNRTCMLSGQATDSPSLLHSPSCMYTAWCVALWRATGGECVVVVCLQRE